MALVPNIYVTNEIQVIDMGNNKTHILVLIPIITLIIVLLQIFNYKMALRKA